MRILTRPNLGGPTRQAIALWHAHRAAGVSTLLVTGDVGGDEDALLPSSGGVPAVDLQAALTAGPNASGWVTIPCLGRRLSPFADLRARARLRALVRAHRPDVVHTHTSKAGWLGRSVAIAERVPVVAHTFHGHVLSDYFGRVVSALLVRHEARLAARTDLLFAVSASCADELAALGVASRERFEVVPPAVATEVAAARADVRVRLGIGADEFRVVAVGRLVPIKRFADFVAAIAASGGLRGDLVGDGPERRRLAALVRRIGGDRVVLRGAMPHVARDLVAWDALVVPSVREGCPLVAVEAFAAGVPVVGYDVPGVRDVLSTWGAGVLVPVERGPAGLAAAVARLRTEPGFAAANVAVARRAVATFAPAAVGARLLASYQRAMAPARQGTPR